MLFALTPQQEWQILDWKQIVQFFKSEHLSVNTNEWELSHWWWWGSEEPTQKGTAIMASCMLGGNT